jgi:RimJ/RimL family protein N-acetyltransferase
LAARNAIAIHRWLGDGETTVARAQLSLMFAARDMNQQGQRMPGPTLETARLLLRPPCADDFDAWAATAADPEAMRFIGGAMSRPTAWRNMCAFAGAWIVRGFSNFSVVEKTTGRWIGRAGPWQPEGWPGTEIGWALDRSAWGKGYATEAAVRCATWVFDELGWSEIVHVIDPANIASIRVAERLGSRRRGPTRLPPPLESSTVDLYGQERNEWRARLR